MIRACLVLHVLAAFLWLGHMFFWSLVVGPVLKRWEPAAQGGRVRVASTRHGGLGWPALVVLGLTGVLLLFRSTASGGAPAWVLSAKLALVGGMVAYQVLVGHRPAPRLIYLDMLAALLVLLLSVGLAHPDLIPIP